MANNKYVCAENGGNSPLLASRDGIGHWEKFKMSVIVASTPSDLPVANITKIPAKSKVGAVNKNGSEWVESQRKYINAIKINKIGAERVNKARALKGLPLISSDKIVTDGIGNVNSKDGEINKSIGGIDGRSRGDIDGRSRGDIDGRSRGLVEKGIYDGQTEAILPSYVDNSQLKYFPEFRDQGGTGSCSAFSGAYYVFTHMNALARDIDVKRSPGNANRFSPKFSYNLTNGGTDSGISDLSHFYSQISKNGAALWDAFPFEAKPYSQDSAGTSYNAKVWPSDPGVWFKALDNRPSSFGKIDSSTDAGINEMKLLLNNGYVLHADFSWGNDILPEYDGGIRGVQIKNNPKTTADDTEIGKIARVGLRNPNVNSGHAITIVGYSDDIWCDINNNNIMEKEELGGFLKVDSYNGMQYPLSQREWFSYEYLRKSSTLPNAPSYYNGKVAGLNSVYWMTVNKDYKVNFVSEITVDTNRRDALGVRIGYHRDDSPNNFNGVYIASYNGGIEYPGIFGGELNLGAYNFSGGTTVTTNTIYMDLTSMQNDFNLTGVKRKWITELSTWGKNVGMHIRSVKYRDIRVGGTVAEAVPDTYVYPATTFPYTMKANSILYAISRYTYPVDPNASVVTIKQPIYGPNSSKESTDIIRSTLTNAYTITANGERTGFGKNNAFDLKNSTIWRTVGSSPDYSWIKYRNKTPYKISKYAITSGTNRSYDPTSWAVLASKDGDHWVEVDRQYKQSFTGNYQKKYYKFKYSDTYSYYKLVQILPVSTTGPVEVAGIEFIQ
jgi:hypothetical protein